VTRAACAVLRRSPVWSGSMIVDKSGETRRRAVAANLVESGFGA
jgi:hypothetical protein